MIEIFLISGLFLSFLGIFWTVTYILIIYRGFKDKTFGMPIGVFCVNIAWEFIFLLVFPHAEYQILVNLTWFSLDVIILVQIVKYWQSEFENITVEIFYSFLILLLGTSLFAIYFTTIELKDWDGLYSAFVDNLLMSILFILMLYKRDSLRGQSIYIAIFKMLGTLSGSIYYLLAIFPTQNSFLLPFLMLAILIYDLIYIGLIYKKSNELKVNIWKRL